jgi:hypothetical protein
MKHIFQKAKLIGATALSCAVLSGFAFAQGGFKRQELVLGDRAGGSYGISEGGNRVPATVTQVKAIEQAIIVLDASNSMSHLYGKVLGELESAIPANVGVPTMVIRFSEDLVVVQEYTTSRTDIVNAFKKEAANWGSSSSSDRSMKMATHLYDAIGKLSEYTKGKNTHVMLVTDGMDSRNRIANMPSLVKSDMVVSYLNWAWRDFSLKVEEPNSIVLGGGKSRKVEGPNNALAVIARYSGGDVENFTDWKLFRAYIGKRLSSGGAVYQATWDSSNPELPFKITAR